MVRVGVARGARLFHLVCLVPQIMIHYPRWNVRNVHKAKQTQIYHRHGKPEASFPPLATFLHLPLPPLFHYLSLFSPFTTPPSWVSDTQDIVFACAVVSRVWKSAGLAQRRLMATCELTFNCFEKSVQEAAVFDLTSTL